jgi:TldD protein
MQSRLATLESVASEIGRRARDRGVFAIWRAQERVQKHVLVREGRAESTSAASVAGQAVQVVTPEGHGALASRDDLSEEAGTRLLDSAIAAALGGARLGLVRSAIPELAPLRARRAGGASEAFEALDLAEIARALAELEARLRSEADGVTLQVGYRAELDGWRVCRQDGTDVSFSMPRCTLSVRATGGGETGRHGVGAVVFSSDPRLIDDPEVVGRFLRRARHAVRLASRLPAAPLHPAGTFPLVIDYALAKGLAHEAFGHAAEADSFRSSVLARDGRFRSGERVGASHVSIVDEPIENDHAWQPYSANGLPRERVVIVERGRLAEALSDPWTAEAAGVRLTGSARAESFRDAPQPRMSNIRIEVDDPLPAPGEFEDYGPAEVRDLLAAAGLLRRHPRWVYLSGYSGGQVNPATGDFMFHCKAIYELSDSGTALFRPAIFSGSMFGALESVREAFGPLLLDAVGHCGKWGQSVPSSGGSHYFLAIEPHEAVRLGGR